MKRALILQHVEWEAPGAIIEALQRADVRADVCAVHEGDHVPARLDDRCILVVLGGPFSARDLDPASGAPLRSTLELVRARVDSGAPLLGVGFGAAIVAHAARWGDSHDREEPTGGERPRPAWAPVNLHRAGEPVLDGVPDWAPMFHWCLEPLRRPQGSVALASSTLAGQGAFRIGPRQFGFSFSVDVDAFAVAERLWRVEELFPDGGDEVVWADTKRYIGDCRRVCDRLLDNVVRLMVRP
jgi:GMP synthase-like glutamine amidotransferase